VSGMSGRSAVEVVRRWRGPGDVVITTMGTARDWMAGPMTPLDVVLVPSSMGQATSLGLGIALAQPTRRVVVLNGDGSLLMNLGSLVTIAAAGADNLVVVVFANGVYEITGAQPVPGVGVVDWVAMAGAAGIRSAERIETLEAWEREAPRVLAGPGPTLVSLTIEPEAALAGVGPRSPGPAAARGRALREALTGG